MIELRSRKASGSFSRGSIMAERTMNAVVFKGPHKVALEKRPVPKIKDQTDMIVKVIYSALCGRLVAPRTIQGAIIEC